MNKFLMLVLVVVLSVFSVACDDTQDVQENNQTCVDECEINTSTCQDDSVMVCRVNELTGCTELVEEEDCLEADKLCKIHPERDFPYCSNESICGNGVLEFNEGYEITEDGIVITGYNVPITCLDFGYDGGELGVSEDCRQVDLIGCW